MPKGRRSPSPVRAYGARKHENGVRKREEGFLYPNGFIARCLRFACLLVSTRDKDPKRSAFVFPGPAPSSLEINSFFSVKTSQRLISMQRNPLFFLFLCVSFILRTSLSGTLETLPELVMPLKGHSSSPCSCPPTLTAPSERFGY